MKFKKIMLITFVLLAILTIGAVSANEGDFNETLAAENVDEVSIDASVDDEVILDDNSGVNIVGAGDEVELQSLIENANGGDVIYLDKNYTFTEPVNDGTSIGISVDKAITIDGQGHTINANNYCTIFAIDSPDITLRSIIFKNGCVSDDFSGGALGGGNPNLSIVNCTFDNNNAVEKDNAGAIAMIGDNITIMGCSFVGNTAFNNGGAIVIRGNGALISNCYFLNNKANSEEESESRGGAIFIQGKSGIITNCGFVNNTADLGSDIYIEGAGEDFTIESYQSDAGESGIYFAKDEIIIFIEEDTNYPLTGEDVDDGFVAISLPSDMDGIVVITSGENVLFNKTLSNFDDNKKEPEEDLEDYTRYVVSPLDVNSFEGLYNEDVIKIAVYDDEDELSYKNYKIFFDDDTVRFEEFNEDTDDGVIIYVEDGNECQYDLDIQDDAESSFAWVSVQNELNGNISIFIYNDDDEKEFFLNKQLNEIEDYLDDEEHDGFTRYFIHFNDIENLDDFKYLEVFTLAFIDDDGEVVDSHNYKVDYDEDENVIMFFEDNEDDTDDGVIIYVEDGNECQYDLDIQDDAESSFAWVSVQNELNGNISIFIYNDDEKEFFLNKQLNEIEDYLDDEEHDGFTRYFIHFNDIENLDDFKYLEVFTLAFIDDDGEVVDSHNYKVDYDEDENVIMFFEDNGDDEDDEESFVNNDKIITNTADEDYENVVIATYDDTNIRQILIGLKDGVTFLLNKTIAEEDFEDGIYKVYLEDLNFYNIEDRDIIRFVCFDDEGNLVEDYTMDCSIKVTDDYIQFYNIEDEIFLEFYSFYGNLTTGDLNDDYLMGWHPNSNFIEILSPNELNDLIINVYGGEFTQTYTLEDMEVEYDYSSLGYIYMIRLDDGIKNTLPENQVIIFNYICNDANVTQKRIRQEDYVYKIITPDDVFNLFLINITDEKLQDSEDVVVTINATGNANRQSIYIDLSGGYFCIYVNDVKVEDLGRLVRIDHETELELFRLCGHDESWPNLGISLADLGITEPGSYNIKVTHIPEDGEGEFIILQETELINKNITFKSFNPIDPEIEVSADFVVYPDDIVINIVALSDATGMINITIDGNMYAVSLIDGKASLSVPGLNAGNYTVAIDYSGDDKYIPVNLTVDVECRKADSTISVENAEIFFGQTAFIPVIMDGADINATVVDYPDADIELRSDGIAIGGLPVGNYTLKVVTVPDENHNAAEATAVISVKRAIVNNDNFADYFDEDGKLKTELPELVFVGNFENKVFYIDKPVTLIGENAIFSNSKFNIESDNVTILNLELNYDGETDSVIFVDDVSNFNLKNNNITFNARSANSYAVKVASSDAVSITDNIFRVTSFKNVDCILISDSYFEIMSNNIYVDAAENANGVYIIGSGNGTVDNNKFDVKANKTVFGINTNMSEHSMNYLSYKYNFISLFAFYSVGINDHSEDISENTIIIGGNYGVAIIVNSDNATVTNNEVIVNTSGEGHDEEVAGKVDLESTGVKVNNDGVTLTENNVDSSGTSILLKGNNAKASGNTLLGQTVIQGNNNLITGNDITNDKGAQAIILTGTATGNTITDNLATGVGTKGDDAVSNEGAGTNTISGNLIKPELKILPISDIFEGQSVEITINAEANFTGDVTLQVGNYNTSASLNKGVGKVTIAADKLSVGEVIVKAIFKGNEKYGEDKSNTTFTVKAKVATTIKATAVTTTYGTSKNVVVTLTDANNNPLSGKSVTIVLNGVSKTLSTDDKGKASLAIGTALAPKAYDVTFTFAGDSAYTKSTGSVKVTVKKATPKLTAKKKTFRLKKAKKYTVTLKTDKGKALKNAKVTLTGKFKGKKIKITKKTNAKGKVTFNLKKLTKKGKFTATVKFAGNTYYNKATSKVKITVKK